MTATDSAITSAAGQRWRTVRWVILALVVIAVVATVSAYLTAPRPGGRMDPGQRLPKAPTRWSRCYVTMASK